jgi:hypothetical protein
MADVNWFFGLGVVIASSISAFLGAYFKRKGENLATHEDIGRLTETTENIKAAISEDVWDRQEQWKLRRDAIIEVMRDISSVRRALVDVYGTFVSGAYLLPPTDDQQKKLAQFYEHFSRFFCSKFVVEVVTGEDLTHSLEEFQKYLGDVIKNMINGKNASLGDVSIQKALAEKTNVAIQAARKELGIKSEDGLSLV